ncbi:MAG TPA: DUF6069 family protein [Acidimicrobiia bacterium]|nr:DUF6069 family protein [Acidimicrobiia bacterium]
MDESAVASPSLASGRRRASSVLAAVGVAVVITLVVEVLVGYDLRSPAMSGNPPIDIGAGTVAVVAALVGLAAWALASILEPRVARPRRIWTTVAAVVLAVSLFGPFSGPAATADRLILTALHLVVGAILIVAFRPSLPESRTR